MKNIKANKQTIRFFKKNIKEIFRISSAGNLVDINITFNLVEINQC